MGGEFSACTNFFQPSACAVFFFAKLGIFPFFSSSLYSCANSAYFSSGSGSQNSGSGKEILRKFLFLLNVRASVPV
jgi:hypothetical protein